MGYSRGTQQTWLPASPHSVASWLWARRSRRAARLRTSVIAAVRMGIGGKSGWIGAKTGGYPLPRFSSNSPEQLGHRATSRSLRSGKSVLAAQLTQPGHCSIIGLRFVREFGSCVFVVHSDQQLSSASWTNSKYLKGRILKERARWQRHYARFSK